MSEKMRKKVREISTGVLRAFDRRMEALPLWVMADFRLAIKEELLARELPLIAEESGGYPCMPPAGLQ